MHVCYSITIWWGIRKPVLPFCYNLLLKNLKCAWEYFQIIMTILQLTDFMSRWMYQNTCTLGLKYLTAILKSRILSDLKKMFSCDNSCQFLGTEVFVHLVKNGKIIYLLYSFKLDHQKSLDALWTGLSLLFRNLLLSRGSHRLLPPLKVTPSLGHLPVTQVPPSCHLAPMWWPTISPIQQVVSLANAVLQSPLVSLCYPFYFCLQEWRRE